jgi:hypothetical protein
MVRNNKILDRGCLISLEKSNEYVVGEYMVNSR